MPIPIDNPTHIPFVFTSTRRCARRAASREDFFTSADDCYLVEAPAETVKIPPPDAYHGFGPETELWNGYQGEGKPYGDFSYRVEEQFIAKFHGAEIAGQTFFPFIDGNLVVSDFYHGKRLIETHWNPYLTQAAQDPNFRADLLLRPAGGSAFEIREDVLSLDFMWNAYYYHFVIDCLPKFLRIRDYPELRSLPILWRAQSAPFIAQYLSALGFIDQILPMRGDFARCDRVYLPSTSTPNGWTRSALQKLREVVFAAFGIDPPAKPKRLILLSRRDAASRRILNEAALAEKLEELDFELVVPGALPVEEQIRLFAEARIIVGPHGSAWANIVYAGPGAAMLEVQPLGDYHPAMYSIAKLGGVHYGSYMTEGQGPHTDLMVDVGRVVEMVRELLALTPS